MQTRLFRILIGFAATLGIAAMGLQAALPAGEVPTFQARARVVSSGGKVVPDASYSFAFTAGSGGKTKGAEWSSWFSFGQADAAKAVGPHSYPNCYMSGFPVVLFLSVGGIADPAAIEVELRFDGAQDAVRLAGDLFGGNLGILLWRDDNKQPHADTMAGYNRRYWAFLTDAALATVKRPVLFPIVDRLIAGDSDRRDWTEGIQNLARGGFSAIMVPTERIHRQLLLAAGLRRTAGAVYNPPGYAFDHELSPTQDVVATWAAAQAAPFFKAGFEPGDIALYAMSDEPGWYYPGVFRPLTNNPVAMARFRKYIRDQGLSSRDVGAKTWERVWPLGRSKAVDLPSKRLFYWTMRFFAWDSARHFARSTRALEAAFSNEVPIFVNWNFFSGRFYVPGPVANNGAKNDPDSAMGGHDWLEFGRMRGCNTLWTEDWFGDELAYQWSYYCARLRSAAALGGVSFGGYVIPRTAGGRTDGILQKILTIVGSGGKAIKYFVFGPEYNFPGNCYSENARVLPKMAEAHGMIAAAEDLLWPGRRPRPEVAILMPRSSQVWDAKEQVIARGIDDATFVNLNSRTVDYMAEVYNLYMALQHANIPVDIVDEDDLNPSGLKPYRAVYITEPDIPVEGQKGLLEWTKSGGTLVAVAGAGAGDRYDDPCDILARGTGIREAPRGRVLVSDLGRMPVVAEGSLNGEPFKAIAVRSTLEKSPGKDAAVDATFADGTPAIIRRQVGKGEAVRMLWMPGLSYARTPTGKRDGLPVGWSETIRRCIVAPVTRKEIKPPVLVSQSLVEAPLLVSDKGAVVTLLNWTGETIPSLDVSAAIPFVAKTVQSVKNGNLRFASVEGSAIFKVELGAADFVLLRP